jgi:hypothetical protein
MSNHRLPLQPATDQPPAAFASVLDRIADILLAEGRHALAEQLAFRAAEMRDAAS